MGVLEITPTLVHRPDHKTYTVSELCARIAPLFQYIGPDIEAWFPDIKLSDRKKVEAKIVSYTPAKAIKMSYHIGMSLLFVEQVVSQEILCVGEGMIVLLNHTNEAHHFYLEMKRTKVGYVLDVFGGQLPVAQPGMKLMQ